MEYMLRKNKKHYSTQKFNEALFMINAKNLSALDRDSLYKICTSYDR